MSLIREFGDQWQVVATEARRVVELLLTVHITADECDEIDEHRFCADAFVQSQSRIVDRDAFLAFACDYVFELLHDDDDSECQPTWWLRFSQAVGEEAADYGAGVRRNDGTDGLPIDQPPNLFPDEVTRELLGQHVMESSLST